MNDQEPEQTGAEQSGADPGTPGSGAEESPRSDAEEVPRSEEEVRARIEEQIRNLRVQDLMVESVVSVLNLTARRIAKEDERDLDQGRVGIDAVRAWIDLLPEEAANQIRNALSELQMLYAQAAGGSGPGEGSEEGPPAPEAGTGGEPPPKPPPAGEPPPRIWTPPGSN
jgi:hypothetical protein